MEINSSWRLGERKKIRLRGLDGRQAKRSLPRAVPCLRRPVPAQAGGHAYFIGPAPAIMIISWAVPVGAIHESPLQ